MATGALRLPRASAATSVSQSGPYTYGGCTRSVQVLYSGKATVDLISSIDKSAVTLWTFTSEISA